MPYICLKDREKFDGIIRNAVSALTEGQDVGIGFTEGELNYLISGITWRLFAKNRRYKVGNALMGVLECVKLELYRRLLAPYEEKMIQNNGDLDVVG